MIILMPCDHWQIKMVIPPIRMVCVQAEFTFVVQTWLSFPCNPNTNSLVSFRFMALIFADVTFRNMSLHQEPHHIPLVRSMDNIWRATGHKWFSALLCALVNLLSNWVKRKRLFSFYLWTNWPRELTQSQTASKGWSWDLKPTFWPQGSGKLSKKDSDYIPDIPQPKRNFCQLLVSQEIEWPRSPQALKWFKSLICSLK